MTNSSLALYQSPPMQIEFIGCTSAGKSTLIEDILQIGQRRKLDMLTSYDFVLKQPHLNRIKNHMMRMVLIDLSALLACLITWRKNLKFLLFATRAILQLPASISWFEKLKIARLVIRNVGIYTIVCHFASDQQIVLADEGTIQIAHSLFVHVSTEPNMGDLESFIQLVPLPDAAVYVTQSESVLIERTIERGHKRIPDRSYANVERFIKRATEVFNTLAQQPALERRLIEVDGQQNNTASQVIAALLETNRDSGYATLARPKT